MKRGQYRGLAVRLLLGFFLGLSAAGQSQQTQDYQLPSRAYDSCGIVIGSKAVGSGFWIGENKFITCLHVVGEAGEGLVIRTTDGATFRPVGVKYFSAKDDLAILYLNKPRGSWLRFGMEPSKGTKIWSVGNSEGGEVLKTDAGVVESLGPRFLEVSAQIRPGCSGGPIVVATGELVAMSALLRFRAVEIRDGKLVYDKSLNNARKFGVRASLIRQGDAAVPDGYARTIAEARTAYYEHELAPSLFAIDRVMATPFYNALNVKLTFEHRVTRNPTRTDVMYLPAAPGSRIAPPTLVTSGGEVVEDRVVMTGGDPEPLRQAAILCAVANNVLDDFGLDEESVSNGPAVVKNLRTLLTWLPKLAQDYLALADGAPGSEFDKVNKADKLRVQLITVQKAYTEQMAALRKSEAQ